MRLTIYGAEGTVYDRNDVVLKEFEYVRGAIVKNQAGTEIVSVSGSDEYNFEIEGVVDCSMGDHKVLNVIVEWTRRGTP